jgi:crotonobetainyl-CoA:carnitine CoA-transferase CaiB-like acyl-CoA transferase
MGSPLAGIRVLDLSRVLAGPWCTQILADLGAEVIKIERPGSGDDTRSWGPPFASDQSGRSTTESAYFLCANRGKKSVAIDLSHREGRDLVRALARKADVLVENFKVGSLAKLKLDYEALAQANPGLIYCSITGFGQTGPYSQRPGYDFMIQALSGLMSINGEPEGKPGSEPLKVGLPIADILTGLYASTAILAALRQRDTTGKGDHIDMSLLDVQVASLANQAMSFLTSGEQPVRSGNAHPSIVPYEAFATADGFLVLAIGNDAQFRTFCRLAGRADLAEHPDYATNPLRVANRAELLPQVRAILQSRSTGDWIEILGEAGVPCGPVNSIADVFADPQVQARGMRLDLVHRLAGTVPSVASPLRFRGFEAGSRRAPPTLGEHTDEVLMDELSLSPDAIAAMKATGVI